ncbi:N-myristoyl transferase [Aureobasidium sp. EXF-10727]|nr:N-myristoyl transferase [Aureobasidium sp. EXF-10727]
MPQQESKPIDAPVNQDSLDHAVQDLKLSEEQSKSGDAVKDAAESGEEDSNQDSTQAPAKKSKKTKIKDAVASIASSSKAPAAPTSAEDPLPASTLDKLSDSQINQLVQSNPALAQAMLKGGSSLDARSMRELLKSVSAADLMTGMSSGKNAKDMANYKFWSTQPVPRFDDKAAAQEKPVQEGPIKEVDPDKVSTKPSPLVAGFEWSEIDLLDEAELKEVQELLCNHYVEDDEAMFRFNYLNETLNWALKAPGWRKSWHVGVRATKSRKLVAFISGVPVRLNVRDRLVNTAEINFLCVHKKLRSKRLAPVLIMEITRRCNLEGIYQAIYTAGVVLPKPVASCRYFHRALDWEKLYNVGFSPLPHGSTKMRQISKYRLPERTVTPGLRLMRAEDADQVTDLLERYMKRVKMAQEFNKEEVLHWFLDKETDPKSNKRVVWTYVVEDANKKITDFFSFYCLESSVIHNASHSSTIRAAYLFYYATESAFATQNADDEVLKARLNLLVKDALILAKQNLTDNQQKAKFDVFNALTLLDNPLFLADQKFGPGDGQLHYYLFNYRTADLPSGVDAKNQVDARQRGGVGVVML